MSSPRQALNNARRRRARVEGDTEAVATALRAAVRQANEAGMPKSEIARLAGVSRQTVYDILGADA